MLEPEEIIAEQERVRAAVSKAKAKLEDAMDSGFWSYTREYELGKLDVARKILEEVEKAIAPIGIDPAEPIPPVTPSRIIEVVAEYFNFTPPTLAGRSKEGRVVLARWVAMYLIRQETDSTLALVGMEIGGRTPATIHYAYGKIADQLLHDGVLRVEVSHIQRRLRITGALRNK